MSLHYTNCLWSKSELWRRNQVGELGMLRCGACECGIPAGAGVWRGAAREENKTVMLAWRRQKLGTGVVEEVLFPFYFLLLFNQSSDLCLSFAQQSKLLLVSVMFDAANPKQTILNQLFLLLLSCSEYRHTVVLEQALSMA